MGKKLARYMWDYIVIDQTVSYKLNVPVFVAFEGPGIGMGNFDNGILKITSVKGQNNVQLYANPFEANTHYWNGPDLIPNDWEDGSMEASLWHDLICQFKKQIAKAFKTSVRKVIAWANGILSAAWRGYSKIYKHPKLVNLKAKIAYRVCQIGYPIYAPIQWIRKKIGRLLMLALLATVISGCAGCSPEPDWHMTDASKIDYTESE